MTIKVSLKLARRIEMALADAVGSRVSSLRTSVGTFDTELAAKSAAQEKHYQVQRECLDLVELRYKIRSAISKANETSGINALICDTAQLEALAGTLKALSAPVNGEVRAERTSAFSRNETVQFKPVLDTSITDLKFRVSSIKDRIAGINAQTTIELTDSEVVVLKGLGIPV